MASSQMNPFGLFAGIQIIEDPFMTETVEDWSKVRSPSRARRRRKKHRQNIRFVSVPMQTIYQLGNKIICHPDICAKIMAALK